jgi:histidinol dehydrogenase
MKIIRSKDKEFADFLALLAKRNSGGAVDVEQDVREIIDNVRAGGDKALSSYTLKFDNVDLKGRFFVTEAEINRAFKGISKKELQLLELASARIEDFHKKQLQNSWFVTSKDGTLLGSRITPLERVGIYVPGGKAVYPSTVLMNAVPAKVAGVDTIIMATPPGKAGINPYVLASAKIAGVDKILRSGGAQAIAALAYGTLSVPCVDKITGPGNIYVATAKRLVYGAVDIDMIAGPSEILIINDGTGDPAWMAADLLSQAEHDELASCVFVTTSHKTALAVMAEVKKALKRLERRAIAEASINNYGAVIIADDINDAARISNRIAPEHLELAIEKPLEVLGLIRNAGAIFLGAYTPEALGDYVAGPNHTLPTGGTARFSSPLGVEDFIKRSSVIGFSKKGFDALGPAAIDFANLEGLDAHAESVSVRLKKKNS